MQRIQAFICAAITLIAIPFCLAEDNTETTQQPSTPIAADLKTDIHSLEALIGTEQFIDGIYTGSCLGAHTRDICWQRVTTQAADDLRNQLEKEYGDTHLIDLLYVDFEGRQRDEYENKRLAMTADGRFYFDVIESAKSTGVTTVTIHRKDERRPTHSPAEPDNIEPIEPKSPEKKHDPIDVTLYYSWDGNDQALNNDLAISSDRWGLGVWANNRIGFLVFQGIDTIGIADASEEVINSSATYQTMGIGLGFRLWDTRGINIENALYIVDAKPFSSVITPNCTTCSATNFTAEDYLQATVNIKTNSRGVNLGWMFTWKALEETANIDALSSGFYIEAQF